MTSRIRITLMSGDGAYVSITHAKTGATIDGPHLVPAQRSGHAFLEFEVEDSQAITVSSFPQPPKTVEHRAAEARPAGFDIRSKGK